MAAYEYDDFWVEFSPRAGGGYSVAARAPDGATSKGSFQLPFTNEQLEAAVRTLGRTAASSCSFVNGSWKEPFDVAPSGARAATE